MSKVLDLGPVSAYALAVQQGFCGTLEEWLASLVGKKGDKGEPGAQGLKGDPGEPGSDASVTADNITTALGYTPANAEDVTGKLDRQQGAANAGKVLGVGGDGLVVPVAQAGGDNSGILKKLVDLTLTEAAVVTITQADDGTPLNLGDFDVDMTIPAMPAVTRILVAPNIGVRNGLVGQTTTNAASIVRAIFRLREEGYSTISGVIAGSTWVSSAPMQIIVPRGGYENVKTCTQICIGATDEFTALPAGTNIKVHGKQVQE